MNRTSAAVASGPGCHVPPSQVCAFSGASMPEQADTLTAKPHSIAIGSREAMYDSCAVNVGLGERRHGRRCRERKHTYDATRNWLPWVYMATM
jgi:hypothetical protein